VKTKSVNQIVNDLLANKGSVTNRDIAERAKVSRQAVHAQLRSLVALGELVVEGAGRSVRYRRPSATAKGTAATHFRFAREGLAEIEVWRQIESELTALSSVPPNAKSILHYAFTEILNNAIDHSRSPDVEGDFGATDDPIWFEVLDHGVGVFEHIRATLGLESREHAIEHVNMEPVRARGFNSARLLAEARHVRRQQRRSNPKRAGHRKSSTRTGLSISSS
jgi:signal transduction histidine kinase